MESKAKNTGAQEFRMPRSAGHRVRERKSPALPGFLTNIFFDQFYFASLAI
jgi:hypothetical protein